ncbi:hypothetical protein [Dethiosulfatarculus sandiegensis]|uniref:Peptidase M12B domain-containing protein n=1 Tax=Dethiosulfatarculus sandiegensis TaxID=1429043 RepID=A0A0D2JYR1_9BACT|nr:hypothetical protein [Dethiosulfatarculus sandiegensis]KIX14700.1 hypothetical protein X474_07335 [Dethiosulfatarculus sandiegensis]
MFVIRLFLIVCLSSFWLLHGSALTARAGSNPVMEALKITRTNYALTYNDYAGQFVFEAIGDKGGYVKLHLALKGFYLRPVLTLSQSRQGLFPENDQYWDTYEVIPQSITVTAAINNTRHCVNPKSSIYSNFNGNLSRVLNNPAPPNNESTDTSIPQWIYGASSNFLADVLRFSFKVRSRLSAGGKAWLAIDAYALVNGTRSGKTTSRPDLGKIFFTQDPNRAEEHISIRGGRASWRLPGLIEVKRDFSLEDISLNVTGSSEVNVEHCAQAYVQESDENWHLKYRFIVAAQKRVSAVLRAEDKDAETWLPEPDQVRSFTLELVEPTFEEVEAVRFVLENTSTNPGVATNAGNHLLYDQCPDCTLPKEPEIYFHNTDFSHDDGSAYPVRRSYVHYNHCPIDDLPDAFFSEKKNANLDLSDQGVKKNLRCQVSQSAKLEKLGSSTIPVKVTIKDGAACTTLKAEVKVAGVWHPALAKGPAANRDETHILIPNDQDHDQVADAWQKDHAYQSPDEDLEILSGGRNQGDGLSLWEEYRGLLVGGDFLRTDPARMDVFVHDYAGQYLTYLDQVADLYAAQGLDLRRVYGDEHKEDVVNYQDSAHKNGDQYLISVMALSQCPGLDFGKALGRAYDSPPLASANTVIINDDIFRSLGIARTLGQVLSGQDPEGTSRTRVGVLAHEIGHNLDLPHHGEGDREIRHSLIGSGGAKKEAEIWVACQGGEHSGDPNCFMRYNCADYYLERDFVPQSWLMQKALGIKKELKPFSEQDYGAENCFCTQKNGSGPCGNATTGGECLRNIKVRSF